MCCFGGRENRPEKWMLPRSEFGGFGGFVTLSGWTDDRRAGDLVTKGERARKNNEMEFGRNFQQSV